MKGASEATLATERVTFTLDQRNRLGHWLSECLDDAAPMNERMWAGRADWMTKGPTFQAVLAEVITDAKAAILREVADEIETAWRDEMVPAAVKQTDVAWYLRRRAERVIRDGAER